MTIAYSVGDHDTRPWGTWEVLAKGEGFIIKRIVVHAGEKLSLQSHKHRSEHWTVLSGEAEVTLNEDLIPLEADGTVFIPAGAKHRIHNVGQQEMSFLEIQTGAVLDEADIERFEDQYGRA